MEIINRVDDANFKQIVDQNYETNHSDDLFDALTATSYGEYLSACNEEETQHKT